MRDIYGHGTAVASVIAARGNNGYGIAGYCWQCRVMPVRVSVNGSVTSPQLAAGIRWAADQPGVRIINIGFNDEGTGWYDTRLAQAMRYAQARGILVFASAGNSSSDGVTYPAGYGGAYPVAATDQTDALYPWTTRGAWVPFAAPGCTPVIWVVGVFSEVCGTSVTAPALSGIAGLLLSAKPGLSADQVLVALHAGMVPVSGIGGGRVDALAAFHAIGLDPPPTPPGQPTPPPPPADGKILPSTNEADLETGTLRRRRSYKLALGDGPLTIALTTRKARTCTLTLASADGGQVTVASTTGRYKVRLRENVPAGRYRLTIRCRSARPRPFQLLITSSSVAIG
jgi:subtilisin family serine protease